MSYGACPGGDTNQTKYGHQPTGISVGSHSTLARLGGAHQERQLLAVAGTETDDQIIGPQPFSHLVAVRARVGILGA